MARVPFNSLKLNDDGILIKVDDVVHPSLDLEMVEHPSIRLLNADSA